MEGMITKKSQYWQMIPGICILAVIMVYCPSGKSHMKIGFLR